MHNAAFRALGIPAAYVALPCAESDVPHLMRALSAAGGGGNVTVPHKAVAARSATVPTDLVARLGACNTFWGDGNGAIFGDNTDVDGILAALEHLAAPDGDWLVLGTGGSARAVAGAAARTGVRLAVRSRDAARAEAFSCWAATLGVPEGSAEMARVVINATPLGLAPGDPPPIDFAQTPRAVAALDLVYSKAETPFVREARRRGLRAADGRAMLVAQGAAAFTRWFPKTPPPVELMRAAVNAALR